MKRLHESLNLSGAPGAAISRRTALASGAAALAAGALPRWALAADAASQLTWGVHVSLAPVWFDPAEATGIITPFMVLYALHDAMVKPMPGKTLAPSLAESVTSSEGEVSEGRVRVGGRRTG